MVSWSMASCEAFRSQSGGDQFMNPCPRLMQSGGTLAGLGSALLGARMLHGPRVSILQPCPFPPCLSCLPIAAKLILVKTVPADRRGPNDLSYRSSSLHRHGHSREDRPHIQLIRSTILHPLREGEFVLRNHLDRRRCESSAGVESRYSCIEVF